MGQSIVFPPRYRYYCPKMNNAVLDRKRDALLVVDLQNDFCAGGSLAVEGGDQVVAPINRILPLFDNIAFTQDWHPADHVSFASAWPGRSLYDSVEADGIPQVLWPDHCVQGSRGAAFHQSLETDRASVILRKGARARLDSYSAFFENDRSTPTGLDGWLRGIGASELYVAGLATDFCVFFTVLDALRLGYKVRVLEDAIRAVDIPPGGAARALGTMRRERAAFIDSRTLG